MLRRISSIQRDIVHIDRKEYTMLTFKDNKGQGLVEYALILVLVAVVKSVELLPKPDCKK